MCEFHAVFVGFQTIDAKVHSTCLDLITHVEKSLDEKGEKQ